MSNFSYWLSTHCYSPYYTVSRFYILTLKDIIHILFTAFLNCCTSFLTGILWFYLWFTGHAAAIFILLKVILLSEYFPTQNLHCFPFPKTISKLFHQTFKDFIVCLQATFLVTSLSASLPEPIRTYLLPHFPFTCNFIFRCLLQHFLPMWICRSRYMQIRNWFFNISFIAVLQPFVMRQTAENGALCNTHNNMKQIKHMWFRQGSYKTVLESQLSMTFEFVGSSSYTALTCFPCDSNKLF